MPWFGITPFLYFPYFLSLSLINNQLICTTNNIRILFVYLTLTLNTPFPPVEDSNAIEEYPKVIQGNMGTIPEGNRASRAIWEQNPEVNKGY